MQKRKYNKGVHFSLKHKKERVCATQTSNPLKIQFYKQRETNTDSLFLSEREESIKKSRDTRRIKTKRLVSPKTSAHKNSVDKINDKLNEDFFNPKKNETPDPAEKLYKQAKISKNIGLGMLVFFFLIIPFFLAIGFYIFSQAKLSKYIRIKTVLKDENSEYLDEINSLNNKLGISAKRVWLSLAIGILLILATAYFALNTAVLISALLGVLTLIYFIHQLTRNITTYFTLFDIIKKEKSKWSKV